MLGADVGAPEGEIEEQAVLGVDRVIGCLDDKHWRSLWRDFDSGIQAVFGGVKETAARIDEDGKIGTATDLVDIIYRGIGKLIAAGADVDGEVPAGRETEHADAMGVDLPVCCILADQAHGPLRVLQRGTSGNLLAPGTRYLRRMALTPMELSHVGHRSLLERSRAPCILRRDRRVRPHRYSCRARPDKTRWLERSHRYRWRASPAAQAPDAQGRSPTVLPGACARPDWKRARSCGPVPKQSTRLDTQQQDKSDPRNAVIAIFAMYLGSSGCSSAEAFATSSIRRSGPARC